MLSDYTDRDFKGKVYFSKFLPGSFLSVGELGVVTPVNIPYFKHLQFIQSDPSTEWIFTHNFGIVPFVIVLDQNDKDISYAVNVFKNESIVRITTDNYLLTGKAIVYTLGFSIESENSSSQLRWFIQSSSGNLEVNCGYTIIESGEPVVELLLPPTAQPGNSIQIIGENLWRIKQNVGQSIRFGNQISTDGSIGYLESTDIGDCVIITCSRTNNAWTVTSSQGNLNIV